VATVKTIKPGGGGDYADLATWEAWADDQASADQWAECYDDATDMGEVTIASWSATPDASNYPRIYTPKAERHDGTSGSAGAWIEVTSATMGVNISATPFTRVEGIRFKMNCNSIGTYCIYHIGTGSAIIDSNLCVGTSEHADSVYIASISGVLAMSDVEIRNNIIYAAGTAKTGIFVNASALYSDVSWAGNVQNNTVDDCATYGVRMQEDDYGNTATVNVTLENNICTNNGTDFSSTVSNGSVTGNNNCSEDATGDDWDGSDSIINQTPANLFVTEGTDHNLKTGSNAIDAGKTIAGWDWDALHISGDNWRPQGSAWDMGALEKEQAVVGPPTGTLLMMGVGI
jgi:hypothetical protein